MAINQGITVPIFTTFSDKGIKQAETSISGFEKLASNAIKTLGGYFAATKIIEFAKSSVAAFDAENAAATQLSQTINNMGYSQQATALTDFITKTSLATGILKSDLSPAFDTLLRSSKSAQDAQSAFNLALDISAGTGKDLATVTQALSKAQGGNVTALSKLGTGYPATANSGSGGGGAGQGGSSSGTGCGGGGGAGGYIEAYITSPSATYSYTVGTGGNGGSAGTNGYAGGNGASGVIIVTAFF